MLIGTVKSLHIYPVKSMAGIEQTSLDLFWYGFNGDRKLSFVRSDNPSGFPWLTGREVADLIRYQPYFTKPDNLLNSPVRVKTPSGADLSIRDGDLRDELTRAYPAGTHLMQLKRGTYDCMPVSLLSLATIASLSQTHGSTLDPRRFRSNILIEAAEAGESPEDAWVGHTLVFGDGPDAPSVNFDYATQRCPMITLDPDSAEKSPSILKTVATTRNNCVGIYGSARKLGTIHVGSPIYLQHTTHE